jgi:hypothetical protein
MTTESDTTTREAWQQALTRFTALRILFEADDQWGPLYRATTEQTVTMNLARSSRTPEERQEWEAAYDAAAERQPRELERHMETIYDPFIKAGIALVRTPAPDLAALAMKHEACNADDFRLIDYEDEEGELFGIIRADVQRLTGIVT